MDRRQFAGSGNTHRAVPGVILVGWLPAATNGDLDQGDADDFKGVDFPIELPIKEILEAVEEAFTPPDYGEPTIHDLTGGFGANPFDYLDPAIAYSPDYGLDAAFAAAESAFIAANLKRFMAGEINLIQLKAAMWLASYVAANQVLGIPFPAITNPLGGLTSFGKALLLFATGESIQIKIPPMRPPDNDYTNAADSGAGTLGGGQGPGGMMSDSAKRAMARESAYRAALEQQRQQITGEADYAMMRAQEAAMTHTFWERVGYYASATGEAIAKTWNDPRFQAVLLVASFLPMGAIFRGIGLASKLGRLLKGAAALGRGLGSKIGQGLGRLFGRMRGRGGFIALGRRKRAWDVIRGKAPHEVGTSVKILHGFTNKGTPWTAHYYGVNIVTRTDYAQIGRYTYGTHHHLYRWDLGNKVSFQRRI